MVKFESREYHMNISGYQQITMSEGKKEWVRFQATVHAKVDLRVETLSEEQQKLITGIPYIKKAIDPILIAQNCEGK